MNAMRLVLAASVAVLLIAGCAAGVPASPSTAARLDSPANATPTSSATSTVTPSKASAATPVPTDAPTLPETPSPPLELPAIAVGEWVATVTHELTIRAAPGVGAQAQRVLPEGYTGTVIAGPEKADGYRWYAITQPNFEVDCTYECSWFGWVASAGLNGTPWLLPAEPACPDRLPTTVPAIKAVHPELLVACYGDTELSLHAYLPGQGESTYGCVVPWRSDPDWLGYCPTVLLFNGSGDDNVTGASIHPDLGRCDFGGQSPDSCPLVPFLGTSVQVTGHLDDPAAASCVIHPIDGTLPEQAILAQQYCRNRFVVTNINTAP
jgi:hypothetical protein